MKLENAEKQVYKKLQLFNETKLSFAELLNEFDSKEDVDKLLLRTFSKEKSFDQQAIDQLSIDDLKRYLKLVEDNKYYIQVRHSGYDQEFVKQTQFLTKILDYDLATFNELNELFYSTNSIWSNSEVCRHAIQQNKLNERDVFNLFHYSQNNRIALQSIESNEAVLEYILKQNIYSYSELLNELSENGHVYFDELLKVSIESGQLNDKQNCTDLILAYMRRESCHVDSTRNMSKIFNFALKNDILNLEELCQLFSSNDQLRFQREWINELPRLLRNAVVESVCSVEEVINIINNAEKFGISDSSYQFQLYDTQYLKLLYEHKLIDLQKIKELLLKFQDTYTWIRSEADSECIRKINTLTDEEFKHITEKVFENAESSRTNSIFADFVKECFVEDMFEFNQNVSFSQSFLEEYMKRAVKSIEDFESFRNSYNADHMFTYGILKHLLTLGWLSTEDLTEILHKSFSGNTSHSADEAYMYFNEASKDICKEDAQILQILLVDPHFEKVNACFWDSNSAKKFLSLAMKYYQHLTLGDEFSTEYSMLLNHDDKLKAYTTIFDFTKDQKQTLYELLCNNEQAQDKLEHIANNKLASAFTYDDLLVHLMKQDKRHVMNI